MGHLLLPHVLQEGQHRQPGGPGRPGGQQVPPGLEEAADHGPHPLNQSRGAATGALRSAIQCLPTHGGGRDEQSHVSREGGGFAHLGHCGRPVMMNVAS